MPFYVLARSRLTGKQKKHGPYKTRGGANWVREQLREDPTRTGETGARVVFAVRKSKANPRGNTRVKLRDGVYALGRVNGYSTFAYGLKGPGGRYGGGWRVEGDGIQSFTAWSLADAQARVEALRAQRTNPRRGRRRR